MSPEMVCKIGQYIQNPKFTVMNIGAVGHRKSTTKLSMSGKGRAIDNVYIERFFRSITYETIYLVEPQDGKHVFELCADYIRF